MISRLVYTFVLASLVAPAPAQDPEMVPIGRVQPHELVVRLADNVGPLQQVVDDRVIRVANASFLKINFNEISLGTGSRLEVESLLDGQKQVWRWDNWREYGPNSAFFNGDAVRVRLIAGAVSTSNGYSVKEIGVGTAAITPQTLCSASDERKKISRPEVARMIVRLPEGFVICTGWLYTNVNAYGTAGHCLARAKSVWVEHNVPDSSAAGVIRHPPTRDQYEWEGWRTYRDQGQGTDWGVFTTKKNSVTGSYPGAVQKASLVIGKVPASPVVVNIPGYGVDVTPKNWSHTLQNDDGPVVAFSPRAIGYRVDVRGSNSGSPILDPNGHVIGVHSFGDCKRNDPTSFNIGTRIDRPGFLAALDKHASRAGLVVDKFGVLCPQPSVGNRRCGSTNDQLVANGSSLPRNSLVMIQVGSAAPLAVSGFELRMRTRDESTRQVKAYVYSSSTGTAEGKPGRLLAIGQMKVTPTLRWARARTCPRVEIPGGRYFFIAYENPDPGLFSSTASSGVPIRYYTRDANGRLSNVGQRFFMRRILCGGKCMSMDVGFRPSTGEIITYLDDGKATWPGLLMIGRSNTKWGPFNLPLSAPIFGDGCLLYNSLDLPPLVAVTNSKGESQTPLKIPPPLLKELKYYSHVEQAGPESGGNQVKVGTTVAAEVRTGKAAYPRAPTRLTAGGTTTNSVVLVWQDNSKVENGFLIRVSDDNQKSYRDLAIVDRDTTAVLIQSLRSDQLYWFRVKAFNVFGSSEAAGPVSVRTDAALPAAPSDLRVTITRTLSAQLTWQDNSDNEKGFRVERSTDRVRWVHQGDADENASNTVVFDAKSLNADTTYYFRVASYNRAGPSGFSNEASTKTRALAPEAPSDFRISSVDFTKMTVTWRDNSDNEDGFSVAWSRDGGRSWNGPKCSADRDETSCTITGLDPKTQYCFKVRAWRTFQGNTYRSLYTSHACSVTRDPTPATPSNIQLLGSTFTSLRIGWRRNSTDEQGFNVAWSRDGGRSYNGPKCETGPGVTSCNITGLDFKTQYCFKVRAWRRFNNVLYRSDYSAPGCWTTQDPTPRSPSNLEAYDVKATVLKLRWRDNASTETGYRVAISTDNRNFNGPRCTTGRDGVGCRIDNLNPLTNYYFRVRAYRTVAGKTVFSGYSNTILVRTTNGAPVAPANLACANPRALSMGLRWTDRSDNELGFRVDKFDGARWTTVDSNIAPGTVAFKVTGLSPSTNYRFRVRAWRLVQDQRVASAWSNEVSCTTTDGKPAVPRDLRVVATRNKQVDLAWDDSDIEEGFNVAISRNNVNFNGPRCSTGANRTSCTVTELDRGTTYYFKVRAWRTLLGKRVFSDYSNTVVTRTN